MLPTPCWTLGFPTNGPSTGQAAIAKIGLKAVQWQLPPVGLSKRENCNPRAAAQFADASGFLNNQC